MPDDILGGMTIAEESVTALPAELLVHTTRHAVYRCYSDRGELLYVGTSGRFGKRLAAHAEKAWFLEVRGITLEWYPDELEAGLAERRAIHVEHPRYNVVHKTAAPVLRPRRRAKMPPEVRASELLTQEPEMSGAELARRLGVSPAHGRRLRSRVLGQRTEERS